MMVDFEHFGALAQGEVILLTESLQGRGLQFKTR
jgi:hypothetical protein